MDLSILGVGCGAIGEGRVGVRDSGMRVLLLLVGAWCILANTARGTTCCCIAGGAVFIERTARASVVQSSLPFLQQTCGDVLQNRDCDGGITLKHNDRTRQGDIQNRPKIIKFHRDPTSISRQPPINLTSRKSINQTNQQQNLHLPKTTPNSNSR